MSALSRYAFINAKLRGRISNLISTAQFQSIAAARSLVEAMVLLRETPLAALETVYNETGDLALVETELQRLEFEQFTAVARHVATHANAATGDFVAHLIYRHELSAYKNALRCWFERAVRMRGVEEKLPYLWRGAAAGNPRLRAALETIVAAETIQSALTAIPNRSLTAALTPVLEYVARKGSLFAVEIAADRWYYARLRELAAAIDPTDRRAVEKIIAIEIDAININWLVRLREFHQLAETEAFELLLRGGGTINQDVLRSSYRAAHPAQALLNALGQSSGENDAAHGIVFLEAVLRQELLRQVHSALGGYPFTVAVVLAYFILKHNETRTLTTILQAKNYQLSAERIGALL